jgi:hypothetical protein
MIGQKVMKVVFDKLLSATVKEKTEKTILTIAIVSYLVHLLIIVLNTQGVFHLEEKFFKNPIAAIYTPFSFILIYEVYLLIFFLSKSTTIYIGKQYEIITLIVIRRIFKDITYVELTSDWFKDKNDLQFTFDVITSLILFYIIYLFYKKVNRPITTLRLKTESSKVIQFVQLKKIMSVLLVPVFIILAVYTLTSWLSVMLSDYQNGVLAFKKINAIFFDEFFTVLIIVDVLILLFSFYYSDKFHKIIRNSGFVISTILLKISFLSDGIINNLLIVGAVLFGYLILIVHNLYIEKDLSTIEETVED